MNLLEPNFSVTAKIQAKNREIDEPSLNMLNIYESAEVVCEWKLADTIARVLSGIWQCSLNLEPIGEGEPIAIEGCTIPLDQRLSPYSCTIEIPPGKIQLAKGENSITYKLIVDVTYTDLQDRTGLLAGYFEPSIVTFFLPGDPTVDAPEPKPKR